jgi:dihydropteroate synthase
MIQLVGILNVTPDSFSDGGRFVEPKAALAQADRLFADGASLIDIGAESTRPGATPHPPKQEWQRLDLVLPALMQAYPGKISLDTYHPKTAERYLSLGPLIINDVTGLSSPAMVDVIVRHKARCIISHLPGSDIQAAHATKPVTVVQEVRDDLIKKATLLIERGLPAKNIILDPGIGFGKTMALNKKLLEFATYMPDFWVMIGYSRKRFLGEHHMEIGPNLAAGKKAKAAGAAFLRVHDVAGHRQLLQG